MPTDLPERKNKQPEGERSLLWALNSILRLVVAIAVIIVSVPVVIVGTVYTWIVDCLRDGRGLYYVFLEWLDGKEEDS